MNFASDNTGPAHPRVIEALAAANTGYAPSYGAEPAMEALRARLRALFEAPQAEVFLVGTGSAANVLALSCLAGPLLSVCCSRVAHIHTDEMGGTEFYTGGAKLLLVEEAHGRMTPAAVEAALEAAAANGADFPQPAAISLTQVTERGTLYAPADIAAIGALVRARGLSLHMDGARFANAVAALGCAPAEITWRAGVDALSFGGTKNGLLGAEAVVIFDPAKAREFALRRKRGAHLFSKHRFLSAQMMAYLEDDLWLEMARAANARAALLAEGLAALPHAAIHHPVEANMIFVSLPRAVHRRAISAGASYYLTLEDLAGGAEDDPVPARLVCDWSAGEEGIRRFLELVA